MTDSRPERVTSPAEADTFLARYGYLAHASDETRAAEVRNHDKRRRTALRRFQRYVPLPETGRLDGPWTYR